MNEKEVFEKWEERQKELDAQYADVDITKSPPEDEHERIRYFIKKARQIVTAKAREMGRPLFACLVTFGCEMNAEHTTP